MKTFKDNAGRTWTVDVNIATVKRVKSMLGIDLLKAVEGELWKEIIPNTIIMCDIIYVICKPDADRQNIDDEQFGYAMAGDAIELATDALLAELVDFFPEAKRRVFRKMAEKQKRVSTKVADTAHKQLQNPELDKAIDRKIEEIMNSSGNWQELLE